MVVRRGSGYIKKRKLGEGTYATIYLADEIELYKDSEFKVLKDYEVDPKELTKPKDSPENDTESASPLLGQKERYRKAIRQVAIKKIKKTRYSMGIEVSAIREIQSLKKVRSDFVIQLFDIFCYKGTLHLVLEYLESNLEEVIKDKRVIIMPGDVKSWILMILKGLYACHRKFLIHRDIKPNNILINSKGIVKLADFGLARDLGVGDMTPEVITRWYRPPELLFGSKLYSFSVDMWSLGCVFAELFLRTPYFPGEDDFKQLDLIFRGLGTPNEVVWPGIATLPSFIKYPVYPPPPLKSLFTAVSDDALDLLSKMLVYDPSRRITPLNAIKHPYFINLPRPTQSGKFSL
ncbi:probable serine/threonine-protein kinase KIN28 homolog [Nylanderia fulva]|uniref:probable serine/threonine-protein kinase KIN28 homolog n=1 Tax=Nylanderia fulva TaxID=613905 RepID=UPI0010FAD868|nr:probable serine/threonine-protein kinase KIN28 homolog [Nylanderia fulva]